MTTFIRPKDEPVVTAPTAGDKVLLDGASVRSMTIENLYAAVLAHLPITALTDIATPSATTDWWPIVDHTDGSIKKVNASEALAAVGAGVSSIEGAAGAVQLTPFLSQNFGGRLTLVSAKPVMDADVVGSQNLFYAPMTGKVVPVFSSGAWALKTFTSSSTDQVGLTLALAGSANWAADSIHDVFAVIDAGTLKLATRLWDAGMLPTEPQIANNTTITTGTGATGWTRSTAAFDGTTVQADAAAARVSPSNVGQANWIGQDWGVGVTKVISKVVIIGPSDDNIRGDAPLTMEIRVQGSNDNATWHLISQTVINASGGPGQVVTIPISVTEQQPFRYHQVGFEGNGTNAVNAAEIQFFNKVAPASGRRLTLRDGVWVNNAIINPMRTGAATTISVAQYEATYLGTIHIDTATAGQISAHITYGPSRAYGVWNCYNRRKIRLMAGTYSTLNSYTPPTTRLWNVCESATFGNAFSLQVLCGMAEDWIGAELKRTIYLNCQTNPAGYECGIGVDTPLNFSGQEAPYNIDNTGQAIGNTPRASVSVPPFAGNKTFYAIERQANTGTGPQSAFTGPRSTDLTVEWMG